MRIYLDDDSAAHFWLVYSVKPGTTCNFLQMSVYLDKMMRSI